MSDTKQQEQGLLCSQCHEYQDRSLYSKKQIKNKGKRKCQHCVEQQDQNQGKNDQKLKNQFWKSFNDKGKDEVVTVLASDIAEAQVKLGKVKQIIPKQDKYDALTKWLIEGGASFPNLLLRYYTMDYRGIHAKRRLEEGEIILKVPLDLIMTSEVAMASKIGQEIEKSGCNLRSSHSWLAAFLLQEKYNPMSKFAPYIATLPEHYRNMPVFFDDEELKMLKGSLTIKMISDRKISLKSEYDNICKYVPSFADYHYLDFFWSRLAVITRIFGFEVGNVKTDGLVAMADMLNHKRPNETSWTFDNSINSFTITTTRRLLKGAQIFDSYGRKCNSRYFVNYGFALDTNEDNQTVIHLSLPKPTFEEGEEAKQEQSAMFALKHRKLRGQHHRRFQIPFEHKERVTRKATSYLRIVHATPEELAGIPDNQEIFKPVSLQNELKVMKSIAEACQVALDGFDTSVVEDNKILQSNSKDLTMNQRACIIMRRGEKEVCEAYIDLYKTIDEVRDFDERQLKKHLARYVDHKGPNPTIPWRKEMYFRELWLPLLTGVEKDLE